MGTPIELIVGLGNPEPRYLTTRHNAGFWLADLLAESCGGTFRRDKKFHGETCEIEIAGQRIRLLKPLTYMNLSGRAVGAIMAYFGTAPERVLVAYDELDLPPGRVKLKFGGGAAGHNGLTSVIETIGAAFWRLRLGIGHPGPGRHDAVLGYVLSRAPAEQEELILAGIGAAIDALPVLIEQGEQRAKTRLHSYDAASADDQAPAGD